MRDLDGGWFVIAACAVASLLAILALAVLSGCGGEDRQTTTETKPAPTITIDRSSGDPKVKVSSTQVADEICSIWQDDWPTKDDQIFFVSAAGETLITCAAP